MKVIFAINLRDVEDAITSRLGDDAEIVFTATYKEALINALPEKQADVLIVRDKLKGDIPLIKMLQDIRHEHSEMRIIVIAGNRKRGDKEIAQMVGLGIYDIICKDNLPLTEIVSCCRHPKLFRDVSMYYLPDYIPDIEIPPEVEATAPQKKKFMSGLLKGKNTSLQETSEQASTTAAPQMNIELLRKTLKEEAVRESQQDLDGLIQKAVASSKIESDKQISTLNKEIDELTSKISQKESKIKQLNTQLNSEKGKHEAVKIKLEECYQETKQGYKVYEEQLSSLQEEEKNTPLWYSQQSEKFANREKELIGEITRLRDGMTKLSEQRESFEEQIKILTEQVELDETDKDERIFDLEEEISRLKDQINGGDSLREEEISDLTKKVARLESKLQDERNAVILANDEIKTMKLKSEQKIDPNEDSQSKKIIITLQNELNATQQQLEEALEKPSTEPIIKYVEKIVPQYSGPDPAMEASLKDLRRDKTELTIKVEQLNIELEKAKELQQEQGTVSGLDYSTPSTLIPIIPDESSYVKSSSPVRLVIMASAKHGTGNTTIALNLATQLAKQGKKTLLMEFNNKHPMTNCYFELMNVPLGIADALGSIGSETSIADSSIIRFHALNSANKALVKTYKKLPPGLHLMTYANKDIVSNQKSYPTREGLFSLLQYLLTKQQYAHVILDIQPEDQYILDAVIDTGIDIDKLILTTSQDPHGLSTVGKLTSSLATRGTTALLGETELVINKYSKGYTSSAKIAKMLKFNPKNISTLSDDTEGYINAAAAGVPYVLTKGHYRGEYDLLQSRIF